MIQNARLGLSETTPMSPKSIYSVGSGELRPSASVISRWTWEKLEADLNAAVESLSWNVQGAHDVHKDAGGFICIQRAGLEVFKTLTSVTPLMRTELGTSVHACSDVAI